MSEQNDDRLTEIKARHGLITGQVFYNFTNHQLVEHDVPWLLERVASERERTKALASLLKELYAYTIKLEGGMAVWVTTRPSMASYPGTQDERTSLGQRVRLALHESGVGVDT